MNGIQEASPIQSEPGSLATRIPLPRAHDKLRHSYASQLVLATRDLFLVSKLLGHTHSRVTEVYAHLMTDHLDRARDAVRYSWGGRDAEPEVLRFARLTQDDGGNPGRGLPGSDCSGGEILGNRTRDRT